MSNLVIEPNKLNGAVDIPPSKKLLQKAIVCACFSKGVSEIRGINMSDDARAIIDAFKILGARITEEDNRLIIDGTDTFTFSESKTIECMSNMVGEVLITAAPSSKAKLDLKGRTRLFGILLQDYCKLLKHCEIECQSDETLIEVGQGKIGGVIEVNEKANSHLVSSILMALPLYGTGGRICVNLPLDSKSYVDTTIKLMKIFGVEVKNNNYHTFTVDGLQKYKATKCKIEGDYLYAAPYLTAGAIGNLIVCKNLPEDSAQENKEIINIIKSFGGEILREGENVAALPSKLRGCVIDASVSPALVPFAALLAAFAKGETVIKNLGELRHKKNDLVTGVSSQLNSLGAMVMERNDELVIEGTDTLKGGTATAGEEATLAVMLMMASTRSEDEVIIRNVDCLHASGYREDFERLGGKFVKPSAVEAEE